MTTSQFKHLSWKSARFIVSKSLSTSVNTSRITTLVMTCFLVGIWWGTGTLQFPSTGYWVLTISLLLLAFYSRKLHFLMVAFSSLTALLLGKGYVSHWRASQFTSYPATITFTGQVVEAPDVRQDKTFLIVEPLENIGNNLQGRPGASRILVKTDRFPKYSFGHILKISGETEKPESFNGFNYPLFLEKSGIYAIMNRPHVTQISSANPTTKKALISLREAIENQIQSYLPEPESSFLAGVLLGSKRAIPEDIQEALKATGTSHIVAISGANITILLSLLLRILPLYSLKNQFYATVGIGSFISLLTGASASVVRGALVASLGRYARMHGRRAWSSPLIVATMTGMVLSNPLLLVADPGFQLSFAAFAGLLYLGSPISQWTEESKLTRNLPELVRAAFAETLAATLGTAPLSFVMFGQLSLLSLVVNPLILWLLPSVTLLGLLFILTSWIPLSATLLSLPLTLFLRTILMTIQWFAGFSFATIHGKL